MSRISAEVSDWASLCTAIDCELRRIARLSVLFSHAVAERLGLHPNDLECLGFLFEEGAVPAGRLAELTGLTTGAITRLIDRLEQAGYVRREPDPRDRRRVLVRPVRERGPEIARYFEPLGQAMAALYARYSDAELALVLDFARQAAAVAQEEVARLRAAPAPEGRKRRAME
jgi:DNA-binding MarR family transcriptional regulator